MSPGISICLETLKARLRPFFIFAGIRPIDLPGFILAELIGAVIGFLLMAWLLRLEGEAVQSNQKVRT